MTSTDSNEHDQETSPALKNKATVAEYDEVKAASEPSKIVGPSLPQPHHSDNEEHSEASDDSSDDDFGPQIPPVGATASNDAKYEREPQYSPPTQHDITTDSTTTKKRQRDDWMVVPPENQSWASGMNPTTLTHRKFNTGKSARGDQSSGGIGAAWTESPTQKRQRLENEVLGIKSEPNTRSAGPRDLSSRANAATANKVKSLSKKESKPSLYESHQKTLRNTNEEDPSSRAFSWEKDIAGKSSMSSATRKKLVDQASGYGSRFSEGKYL